jgi:ketosteroid isomerase-like protein
MEALKTKDKEVLTNFYDAFTRLDAEKMASCYHPEVVFQDPAFGQLKGKRAANMWRMLCDSQQGKDFKVSYSIIETQGDEGLVKWEASYSFSQTGRRVHNRITAHFRFKDGLILEHQDHFNLHRWAGQALGLKGLLLGWTPFFKKKLQQQTGRMLDRYEAKQSTS